MDDTERMPRAAVDRAGCTWYFAQDICARAERLGAQIDYMGWRDDGRLPIMPPNGFLLSHWVYCDAVELAQLCDAWQVSAVPPSPTTEAPVKLSDIELTATQVAAFIDWLQKRADDERARLDAVAAEQKASERHMRWYFQLRETARETARMNGVIEGLSPRYAAAATWDAFAAWEGWRAPFDVDYQFEATEAWRETWELAYMDEAETMARAERAVRKER